MGSRTSITEGQPTSIRVDRGKWDEFKKVAEANERSANQELRWLIDRHIAEAKAQEALKQAA